MSRFARTLGKGQLVTLEGTLRYREVEAEGQPKQRLAEIHVRDNTPIREEASDFYFTDGITDSALGFLDEAHNKGKPFFLYTAYNAPHWPLQAPEAAVSKYRGRYLQGWDKTRADRHRKQIKLGLLNASWPLTTRDPRVPNWQRASFRLWEAERMAVYAAQVDCMDAGIGRIVAKLESMGELDNTLILFLSDNGGNYEEIDAMPATSKRPVYMRETTKQGKPVVPGNRPTIMPGPATTFQSYGGPWGNVSNTPFRLYKHFAHEGGISTPLIAHWPSGIKTRGAVDHSIGHEMDIMATCLALTRVPYPVRSKAGSPTPALEGRSLLPVFRGETIEDRGMLFGSMKETARCATAGGSWSRRGLTLGKSTICKTTARKVPTWSMLSRTASSEWLPPIVPGLNA